VSAGCQEPGLADGVWLYNTIMATIVLTGRPRYHEGCIYENQGDGAN
jgi:hypothetical protein